jgi:inosose dehydratase
MASMRMGCQTYSWEMHGEGWKGTPDEILDAMAEAGYAGAEFAVTMLGPYADRPRAFADALDRRGLVLSAVAYASPNGFTDPAHWEEELAGAERALRFAAEFPRPLLGLGGAASPSRDDYDAKLTHACRFYSTVAEKGQAMGVDVVIHPHSHHGSLLESAGEYARMLELTAASGAGFNPDTGHIVRGGQDLLACIATHLGRIRHVHVKDATPAGEWAPMGQGVCDFVGLFDLLEGAGYDGWVIAEEESSLAWEDPRKAIVVNREYIRSLRL